MQFGIDRLRDFLEVARLPITTKVAATVSGIPEEQIDSVLQGSDFIIINQKIHIREKYEELMVSLNDLSLDLLGWMSGHMELSLICGDGKIIDVEMEGLEWQRV